MFVNLYSQRKLNYSKPTRNEGNIAMKKKIETNSNGFKYNNKAFKAQSQIESKI